MLVSPRPFNVNFPLLSDVRRACFGFLAHRRNSQIAYRTRNTDGEMLPDDFRRDSGWEIRVGLLRHDSHHGLDIGMIPRLMPEANQIVQVRKLQGLIVHQRIRFRR